MNFLDSFHLFIFTVFFSLFCVIIKRRRRKKANNNNRWKEKKRKYSFLCSREKKGGFETTWSICTYKTKSEI